jgi:hypothetical protein
MFFGNIAKYTQRFAVLLSEGGMKWVTTDGKSSLALGSRGVEITKQFVGADFRVLARDLHYDVAGYEAAHTGFLFFNESFTSPQGLIFWCLLNSSRRRRLGDACDSVLSSSLLLPISTNFPASSTGFGDSLDGLGAQMAGTSSVFGKNDFLWLIRQSI